MACRTHKGLPVETSFHRAAVYLRHAGSVAVGTHVNPDGDGIGSVLGLTLALRAAGISAAPTLADGTSPPQTYAFLPGFALFVESAEIKQPDAFVALDTTSLSRLGDAERLASGARELIVIDHHVDNDLFGTVNLVDPAASATAQLVWRFVEYLDIPRTSEIALCCYTGMMTDTGRFAYKNTNARALRDAADMIEAGVEPSEVARLVYQERSQAALMLEARVLSRLTLVNNDRVAYSWCTNEDFLDTGLSPTDNEELPDTVRRIRGVDVAILLRVIGDEVRANLRAKTSFDVAAVARVFGGGGHPSAAGFTYKGTTQELLPKLLALLPGAGADDK